MKFNEIYNVLATYEEENRKGWYSYTFANHNVEIAKKSEANKRWVLSLNKNMYEIHLTPFKDNPEKLFWSAVDELSFDYDADDYYIADQVFHPYIAILHISNAKSILEQIKDTVNQYDDICYCKRSGFPLGNNINININEAIFDCAWAGVGSNERSAAQFHLNHNEFSICTAGYLCKENKHRRHFKEQEWLFPYVSNGFNYDDVLYIQTSSTVEYKGKELAKKKAEIISSLKLLLSEANIPEYDLIEIRHPFKRS